MYRSTFFRSAKACHWPSQPRTLGKGKVLSNVQSSSFIPCWKRFPENAALRPKEKGNQVGEGAQDSSQDLGATRAVVGELLPTFRASSPWSGSMTLTRAKSITQQFCEFFLTKSSGSCSLQRRNPKLKLFHLLQLYRWLFLVPVPLLYHSTVNDEVLFTPLLGGVW